MGDPDYLNDGIYATLDEAHEQAFRLKDIPNDDGVCQFCYLVGEVVSSPSIALENSESLTDSLIEHLAEQVEQLEPFDGIFESYIKLDDEGKAKIEATLRDVLVNHTQYPKIEVIKEAKSFNFADKDAQTLSCPYCQDIKSISPTKSQIEGGSCSTSIECKKCAGFFTTYYNRMSGVLVAQAIRL